MIVFNFSFFFFFFKQKTAYEVRISDWSSDVCSSDLIASAYHLVKVGGDVALLKGIMKALLEADGKDLAAGGKGLLDRDFIAAHTTGFEALRADLAAADWGEIGRAHV